MWWAGLALVPCNFPRVAAIESKVCAAGAVLCRRCFAAVLSDHSIVGVWLSCKLGVLFIWGE